jgi:hypothetical protein
MSLFVMKQRLQGQALFRLKDNIFANPVQAKDGVFFIHSDQVLNLDIFVQKNRNLYYGIGHEKSSNQ